MNNGTQLFLQCPEQESFNLDEISRMEGADGLVINPNKCDTTLFERMGDEQAVICKGDPERDSCWLERPSWWVLDEELDQMARRRDEHPELNWIPFLRVSRARVSYRFSGPAVGEGFSFYMPDTAAVKGWRVNGAENSLHEAVTRVTELGFPAMWLYSPEAEVRGNGLELDLLDKVRGGPLDIWLSGGATETRHLHNLTKVGGAAVVVVNEKLLQDSSIKDLREAMGKDNPGSEAVPIHFERCPVQAG